MGRHKTLDPDVNKPEYSAWEQMLSRCRNKRNPKYPGYGGRGITVCDEWSSFKKFYEDMGKRPAPEYSIDRIDNNSGYSKANCRWATRKQQQNNMRTNRWITDGYKTMTVAQWADELGIKPNTIVTRLKRGWSELESIYGR